jgi:hypothetical protein
MSSSDNIATYGTVKGCHDMATNGQEEKRDVDNIEVKINKREMRRRLYISNYIGVAGYLMDFGFGGFIGYGKGVSKCIGEEELKMYEG